MNDPVILAVQLSSASFLYCRLLHPDRRTLDQLNRWHYKMYAAIGVVQQGDLLCLNRTRVVALHHHWGESWVDVQPRLSPSMKHLKSVARSLKITTIFINQNGRWVVDKI